MTSRPSSRAGFTLIELLVVLAIMGLLVGIVVLRGPLASRSLGVRHAASQLAGALREARAEAIGTDRAVALTIDTKARSFAVGDRRAEAFGGTFAISVATAAGDIVDASVARIRFEPDGSSSGGLVVLDDSGHRTEVGVDWVNGRVRVVDAR